MRSGTTWLTKMLCQHPKMSLAVNGKKEQWLLNRVALGEVPLNEYLELFPRDGLLRGEWSPRYLWLMHTATAAAQLPQDCVFLCVLRDPIERYASHQRLASMRRRERHSARWAPAIAAGLGTYLGLYADQLDSWRRMVGSRLLVVSYESLAGDPLTHCSIIWNKLGLSPEPLPQDALTERVSASADGLWEWPDQFRSTLRDLYLPQLDRLARDYDVDTSSWLNFNDLD
ncbi:sulfotransferase domain-containing protein [Nocardioides conyzicola]